MVRSAHPLTTFLQSIGLVPVDASSPPEHANNDTVGNARTPGCVATPSGKLVSVVEPDLDTIDMGDIAHMLAQQARWNGASKFPVSVAQHSVLCMLECGRRYPGRPDLELACLLHDAAEAYCADLPRPVKVVLGESYRRIEDRVQRAICQRFCVKTDPEITAIVKQIDNAVCRTEAFWLMRGSEAWNWGDVIPAQLNLREMPWERARDWFLSHAHRLLRPQLMVVA